MQFWLRSYGVQVSQLGDSALGYSKSMDRHLKIIQQATATLQMQGTREDQTTGSTPRKRVWEYADEWEVTKDREVLLDEWKVLQAQGRGFGENDGEEIMGLETIPSTEPRSSAKDDPPFMEPAEEAGAEYVDYEIPVIDEDETTELGRGVVRPPSVVDPTLAMPSAAHSMVPNRRITRQSQASGVPIATKSAGLKRPSRGQKRPASSVSMAAASSAPALSEKSNATAGLRKRPKLT